MPPLPHTNRTPYNAANLAMHKADAAGHSSVALGASTKPPHMPHAANAGGRLVGLLPYTPAAGPHTRAPCDDCV